MSHHDVLALDANFENWKKDRASGVTVEPFLYYSVEHITKLYNLTDDEFDMALLTAEMMEGSTRSIV